MTPIRVLYISGTYAPGALSGSELSAHTLLRELKMRGHADVRVISDCRYTGDRDGEAVYEGVPIRGTTHEHRAATIVEEIDSFSPAVLFTQLIWSDVALRLATEKHVRTILRVASLPLQVDIRSDLLAPTALIALTPYVQQQIEANFGRRSFVIHSAINLERALVPAGMHRPRYLTMFNPIDLKGGFMFREIARHMPDREFAAVPGWHSLRKSDGTWDQELINRAPRSEGDPEDWRPEEVDLSGVPNITILNAREAVHEIFAATRILLMPSVWEEAFGRVAVEAFANGIPVVASAVGGLADNARRGGIAVERFDDVDAWIEAIRSLDEPALYADCAQRGRKIAKKQFSLDHAVEDFVEVLADVHAAAPGDKLNAP